MADTLILKAGANCSLSSDGTNLIISFSGTKYTIDSTLSSSSTNPIQNKAVYAGLAGKQDKLTAGTGISISGNTISCTVSGGGGTVTVDSSLSSTSANPVQNKVIYAALAGKQDTLTIDASLSSTSANPVQNKVVYAALSGKQDKLTISVETWTFTLSSGSTVTKKVYVQG